MQFKFGKELPKGLFDNSKGIIHNKMSMPRVIQQFQYIMMAFFLKWGHDPSNQWITVVTQQVRWKPMLIKFWVIGKQTMVFNFTIKCKLMQHPQVIQIPQKTHEHIIKLFFCNLQLFVPPNYTHLIRDSNSFHDIKQV